MLNNYLEAQYVKKRSVIKMMRIMNISAILLFISCLQVNARASSQGISLDVKNVPLNKVFQEIKKQAGYTFIYTETMLKKSNKVSMNVKNVTLQEVLSICFATQPFTYKIINQTIILQPKEKVEVNTNSHIDLPPPPIEIHGRVVNQQGQPLQNASVFVADTKIGTTTNSDGYFKLTAPGNKNIVLEISNVGYQTKKVSVGKETEINVILELEVTGLTDVVVVGYGTQQKKDITGAVSVISSKDLADRSNTNFGYSIEGKTAGVQVLRSSGQPQAGFSIRIRGTSTITAGSEPLYIIDGVPTGSTNGINPSDIESITVLKDASSAAIYGASGANGVVLITTKRGKNQETQVNANVYTGFSNAWKNVPVLNGTQYIDLMTEMGLSPVSGWDRYSKVNTNWQDLVFRTGHSQNYNLSATGGNAKTQFYVSGSLLEQKGIVINNSLERANFKLNIDHEINKIFKFGSSISFDKWSDVDVSENSKNGVIFGLITGVPVIKPTNPDGTYASNPLIADIENPVASAYASDHKWTSSRFNGNTYIEAIILNGLKVRTMLGYEQSNGAYNAFVNPIQSKEGRTWNGIADQSLEQNRYWILENTITYDKNFGKNKFIILGGFITSDTKSNSLAEHATGFGGSAVTTVNGGAIHSLSGADISERSNVSFISRINYSLADKYLLTANFRSDASSVFGPNNRWGYFPSFSAGWRISQEDFFKNVKAINDLKLRVGWGLVGNDQISAYSYLGLVNPSSNYVINNAAVPGTAPITLENPELQWETTDQLNIGVDISLWNSRVTLTSDYYVKRTKDLLLNVPIPASVGIPSNSALQNAGKIENRGVEFQLNSRNMVNKFRWTTSFNISFNQNKVLNMVGTFIKVGSIESRGNTSIAQEGLPLGTFWGYIYEGVDPNTGNALYSDLDKNGDIDEDDKTIIGKANPKYTFGLSNSFNYKNFSVDIFFQGIQGNQIFNATRVLSEAMIDGKSQSGAVLQRWTKIGQVTNIPRQSLNDPGIPDPTYNSLISSRYIEDGSYVRLKSVTIGYTLPETIIKKLGINRCLVYVTGENLLTFTKYSGFDPEVSAFGASNTAPGVDFGTYPQSRDILFGLNISF